jgi:hypothetical protein
MVSYSTLYFSLVLDAGPKCPAIPVVQKVFSQQGPEGHRGHRLVSS